MEKANSNISRKHSPLQKRNEFTKPSTHVSIAYDLLAAISQFPTGKDIHPKLFDLCDFFLIIFFYVLVRCGKFEIGPNFPSLKKKYTSSSAKYLPQLIPFPFLTPVISHQGEKLESRAHIISPQTSKGKHKQIYLSFSLKIKIK